MVVVGQYVADNSQLQAQAEFPGKISEVKSGDGTRRLMSVNEALDEKTTRYTLIVWDKEQKRELWQTMLNESRVELPVNSWSPDNKQVFVEIVGSRQADYYVFSADGKEYKSGAKYLDVQAEWGKSKGDQVIEKITGWAANNLLVVYASKSGSNQMLKYWFVTDTGKFTLVGR